MIFNKIKFVIDGKKFTVDTELKRLTMDGGVVAFYYFGEIQNNDGRIFPFEREKELYKAALIKYKKLRCFL
jgi:hypothetical protein